MRIKILSVAEDDLEEGHRFYESQADGLGTYFLDTLYSDIDSLAYFAGMHRVVLDYTGCSPDDFLLQFITVSQTTKSSCSPCWIASRNPSWIRKKLSE
jgi:hypothetical protein